MSRRIYKDAEGDFWVENDHDTDVYNLVYWDAMPSEYIQGWAFESVEAEYGPLDLYEVTD